LVSFLAVSFTYSRRFSTYAYGIK